MTIRAMALQYGIELPKPSEANKESNSALVFVLNREFFPGFKILLYSMAKNNTLVDLPLLIFSEDGSLLRDPFCQGTGDTLIHVTDSDIQSFKNISSDRIPSSVKLDWIPKYTFLKWMIFDNYGYSQLIWLDSDILCLNNIDSLLSMRECSLYAAPAFPQALIYEDSNTGTTRRKPSEIRSGLSRHLDFDYQTIGSLNSGVMVINEDCLNYDFRDKLIKRAENKSTTTEQTVINYVLKSDDLYTRGVISPFFNFHHGYLSFAQEEHRKEVRLLHYVGANAKPWDGNAARPNNDGFALWQSVKAEAAAVHEVFNTI